MTTHQGRRPGTTEPNLTHAEWLRCYRTVCRTAAVVLAALFITALVAPTL